MLNCSLKQWVIGAKVSDSIIVHSFGKGVLMWLIVLWGTPISPPIIRGGAPPQGEGRGGGGLLRTYCLFLKNKLPFAKEKMAFSLRTYFLFLKNILPLEKMPFPLEINAFPVRKNCLFVAFSFSKKNCFFL
jgi:hypothetical protein